MIDAFGLARRIKAGVRRPLGNLFLSSAARFERRRLPELRGKPIPFGPVRILSVDPPVFLTGTSYDEFLGVAPSFARRYGNVPAAFIVYPTWSIETAEKARYISSCVRRHARRYPGHRFRYICNTPGEAELLNGCGQPAIFLNHKFTVSEDVFRPTHPEGPQFDAVYNARFVAGKRHELAAQIPSVAYIAYAEPQHARQAEFGELWPRTSDRNPAHVLINRLEAGLPLSMSHAEVNDALGRAATGLILSAIEGASYATVEYLLAGLPVVSTPSQGGRDVFLDPDYCAVVDADPRSVCEAVAALKARRIPKEYIREQTLKRMRPGRKRFLALVDEVIEELGGEGQHAAGDWPFGAISGVPWDGFKHHLAAFEKAQRELIADDAGVDHASLQNVQLTGYELRPVIDAIRAKPGGSLLVFGCGSDSAIWEKANAGGVTAFLEHDEDWAHTARAALRSASVHRVAYDTQQADWRKLLNHPEMLAMPLPEAIRARRWDTILVDGPPGYRGELPGRMQSIYEASRLVAPGGSVFVHDAERPAETAYCKKYLRKGRLQVEARGRAVMRGYAFPTG